MSIKKNNIKVYCASKDCSFKPVRFNTFEYMYCDACKSEVSDEMVEYKARRKAIEKTNINPHMSDEDQGDLFDFMDHL